VELHYTWRNGDSEMHQRQIAVFVPNTTSQNKALLLTGTSHGAFKDEWNTAFETMVSSVRLNAAMSDAAHGEDASRAAQGF
ncbi:MAG: DcrB-related protein, partial [Gammaproteobacteria bacterium]